MLMLMNRTEGFSNSVSFISKEAACRVFYDLDYLKQFNSLDIASRHINTTHILNYYCNRVLEFNVNEKKTLSRVIGTMDPTTFPFLKGPWKFCKLSNSLEYGFPHTHKDIIFISQRTMNNMDSSENNIGMLVHEQVHLWQRRDRALFDSLYRAWGFVKVKRPIGINHYLTQVRSNPDIHDLFYAFQGKYIPLSVLDKDGSVNYIALLLKNGKIVGDIPLSSVKDYFKIRNNHYHPNEISAELVSQYVINPKKFGSSDVIMTKILFSS
jgi:hypothetical protein